jgi:predicted lipoprotein with Yx(FWY)xxD motif
VWDSVPHTLLAAVAVAVVLAGCGGGSSATFSTPATKRIAKASNSAAPAPSVSTMSVSSLGQILVNGRGRTLYVFLPDKHTKVTCVGTCAQVWPPFKASNGRRPAVSGSVRAFLLGTISDPEGGRVVTYAGWPLYTYIGDSAPGIATGQALNTNGGLWYVIGGSGKVITTTP